MRNAAILYVGKYDIHELVSPKYNVSMLVLLQLLSCHVIIINCCTSSD